MPSMNGAEFYWAVQNEFENPPKFLFVSGFDQLLSKDIIENSLGVFAKPLDHKAIVEAILGHRKTVSDEP